MNLNFKEQVVDFFTSRVYGFDELAIEPGRQGAITIPFIHHDPARDFSIKLDAVETEESVTAKVSTVLGLHFPLEDYDVDMEDWRLLVERWRYAFREDRESDQLWKEAA